MKTEVYHALLAGIVIVLGAPTVKLVGAADLVQLNEHRSLSVLVDKRQAHSYEFSNVSQQFMWCVTQDHYDFRSLFLTILSQLFSTR